MTEFAFAPPPCLAFAGFGISVNTFMARTNVAMSLSEPGARNTAFSAVRTGVNIAAAVGRIAANLLFSTRSNVLRLMLVAVLYIIRAVQVAVIRPSRLRPFDQDDRRSLGLHGVRIIAVNPAVRRASLVAITGWFLYRHLFSALTLHISQLTTPFVTMAGVGASVVGTFAAVIVFSVADRTFTPVRRRRVRRHLRRLAGGRGVHRSADRDGRRRVTWLVFRWHPVRGHARPWTTGGVLAGSARHGAAHARTVLADPNPRRRPADGPASSSGSTEFEMPTGMQRDA